MHAGAGAWLARQAAFLISLAVTVFSLCLAHRPVTQGLCCHQTHTHTHSRLVVGRKTIVLLQAFSEDKILCTASFLRFYVFTPPLSAENTPSRSSILSKPVERQIRNQTLLYRGGSPNGFGRQVCTPLPFPSSKNQNRTGMPVHLLKQYITPPLFRDAYYLLLELSQQSRGNDAHHVKYAASQSSVNVLFARS